VVRDITKLIAMANQIGDFFEADPDVESAKKEIAGHLSKFWNSIMINAIVAYVQQDDESTLHPRVAEAIKQHLT
jgi:formate dehydrogenase subunit delta